MLKRMRKFLFSNEVVCAVGVVVLFGALHFACQKKEPQRTLRPLLGTNSLMDDAINPVDTCVLVVDWGTDPPALRFSGGTECILHPPVMPTPSPSPSDTPTPTPTPSGSPTGPPSSPPPPAGPWVTAYYAGWFGVGSEYGHDTEQEAVDAVDMANLTHFVFGRYAPGGGTLGGTPGQVLPGAGNAHATLEGKLIAKAHVSGARALLMLGGAGDGPGFDASTASPTTRSTFVKNITSAVNAKGYDGVDVDWEESHDTPAQQAQVIALLDELRAADSGLVLTWPGFWTNLNGSTITAWHAQVAQRVDQFNVMSYAMLGAWPGWESWFTSALDDAKPAHPTSIKASVDEYVASGIPKTKLGVGIGTYGTYFSKGGVTGPRQAIGPDVTVQSNDVENGYRKLWNEGAFIQPQGSRKWDGAASQPYLTYSTPWQRYPQTPGTQIGYLTYEDEQSIAAKGAWVKANGFGGTIVWTINYGNLGGTNNPLMDAVGAALLGRPVPAPTPVPTPKPSPTPSPTPTPTATPTPPPPGGDVGYGAISKGGSAPGGDVFHVKNVNDSGSGSLRTGYANQASPRTYVFDVAGTIKLLSPLVWKKPYTTIDCSSAPAPGITIEQPLKQAGLTFTATHDIKLIGCRDAGKWLPTDVYAGWKNTGTTTFDGDGGPIVTAWDPNPNACATNPSSPTALDKRKMCRIVVRGNTFSGSSDAGPDVWCGVNDITLQNNLVLDSYHPRSTGCDTVASEASSKARLRVTEYGNVYAYNGDRNPKLSEGVYDFDMVNVVNFAWQDYGTKLGLGAGGYGTQWESDNGSNRHNVINSVWMPDPNRSPACIANNSDNACRERWDCVWGSTWKNNNETWLQGAWLFYSGNVYGKWHNTAECVTTSVGSPPKPRPQVPRPYVLNVKAMTYAAMEQVVKAAGVQNRTTREQQVIDAVLAELKKVLP